MKNYIVCIVAIIGAFFILITVPALAQTGGTGGSGSGTGTGQGSGMSPGMGPGASGSDATRHDMMNGGGAYPRTSPGMRGPHDEMPETSEGATVPEGRVTEEEREGTYPGRGEGISPGPGMLPPLKGQEYERSREMDGTRRSGEMERERARDIDESSPRAMPPARNPDYR